MDTIAPATLLGSIQVHLDVFLGLNPLLSYVCDPKYGAFWRCKADHRRRQCQVEALLEDKSFLFVGLSRMFRRCADLSRLSPPH
jgi:hypothetical protein